MRFCLLMAFSFVVGVAIAQPKLLKNFIQPGYPTEDSNPASLVTFKNKVYFTAVNSRLFSAPSANLWSSDGTLQGTNIFNIDNQSTETTLSSITPIGDILLFSTIGSKGGIWKTDGVNAPVKIVEMGSYDEVNFKAYGPISLMPVNDHLIFFLARLKGQGIKLWKTDGTPDGTSLVKDIYPGDTKVGASDSNPTYVTLNDKLYFFANDGVHGFQLWKSDGTSSGTEMVRELFDKSDYPPYCPIVTIGDEFYFGVNEQLWKSNGESSGTVQVSNFSSSTSDKAIVLGALNNEVLFVSGQNEFYVLKDNQVTPLFQPEHAVKAVDWNQINSGDLSSVLHGEIYFAGLDPVIGLSVWKYDGTSTTLLTDLTDLPEDYEFFRGFASTQNRLFFEARNTLTSQAIWQSTGTTEGTSVVVGDIDVQASRPIVGADDKMFFINDDARGAEVWVSDGTESGTHITRDINTVPESFPFLLLRIGELIYFKGYDIDHGFELWKTDGTEEGTVMVKDITPGPASSNLQDFDKAGDKLIFSSVGAFYANQLWTSDGTADGTHVIREFSSPYPYSGPFVQYRGFINNKILLNVSSINEESGLWTSDGTSAGSMIIIPGEGYEGATVANKFYYIKNSSQLWASDGTVGGNHLVKDLGTGSSIQSMQAGSTRLYLMVNEPEFSQELWISDGTSEGTRKVKHIREVNEPYDWRIEPLFFQAIKGDRLYFKSAAQHNFEMWTSDGTESGTFQLKDINPGDEGSDPQYASFYGDALYFMAFTEQNGYELWRTDGTENGTRLVKDIVEGKGSSFASPLSTETTSTNPTVEAIGANDQEVYVTANDGIHGHEIWVTDGTPGKTRLLYDFTEGSEGSVIYLGDKLGDRFCFLFNDDNGQNGIWYIDAGDHWINFDEIEDRTDTKSFNVFASSSAGLPVTLQIVSGPARVNEDNSITPTDNGTITIRATASGNEDYDDAMPVERTFNVTKKDQIITFSTIGSKNSDDAPFDLTASSTSELPVMFTINSGPATISEKTVTLTGGGTVSITAKQPGDDFYNAAADVTQTFDVQLVLGVEDSETRIYVFPNPVSDKLYIQSPTTIQSITFFDVLGRSVIHKTIESTDASVSVDNLAKGMYVLRVTNSAASFTARIEIKK